MERFNSCFFARSSIQKGADIDGPITSGLPNAVSLVFEDIRAS